MKKTRILLTALFLVSAFLSQAGSIQQGPKTYPMGVNCGTPNPMSDARSGSCASNFCDFSANRDAKIPGANTPVKYLSLLLNVILENDGINPPHSYTRACEADLQHIEDMMTYINLSFAPWKIQFSYTVNYILDSRYIKITNNNANTCLSTYTTNVGQQINVFIADLTEYYVSGYSIGGMSMGSTVLLDKSTCYANSATLIHELGHTFGLNHTFANIDGVTCGSSCRDYINNTNAQSDSVGDFCSDTPPISSILFSPSTNCDYDGSYDACSAGNPTWGSNDPNKVNPYNFMSYGSCQNSFTPQQAGRMHCWIENSYASYLSYGATVANNTNPVTSHFVANNSIGSGKVEFTNQSSVSATNFQWDFGDGTTVNESNNVHYFNTAGTYTVKFTVGNGNSSTSESQVLTINTAATSIPYSENFENYTYFPSNWTRKNSPCSKWEWCSSQKPENGFPCYSGDTQERSIIGADGYVTHALTRSFPWNDDTGDIDAIVSPVFDLRFFKDPVLSFYLAYRQWDVNYDNQIKVYYSTDLGATYTAIYDKSGETLATVQPALACKFIPSSPEDWRKEIIPLNMIEGQSTVTFKFEFISGWDNFLYIDGISVTGEQTSVIDLAATVNGSTVGLNWSLPNGTGITEFKIERSSDNTNYTEIGSLGVNVGNVQTYQYDDAASKANGTYYYRLKQNDGNGNYIYSASVSAQVDVSGISGIGDGNTIVKEFTVSPSYPNPIAGGGATKINVSLPSPGTVKCTVYSITGQKVKEFSVEKPSGESTMEIETGTLAPGAYLYSLSYNLKTFSGKFVRLKSSEEEKEKEQEEEEEQEKPDSTGIEMDAPAINPKQ